MLWCFCCTGFPWLPGGNHGLPFNSTSTDCTAPADPLWPDPDSVQSSCDETCCMRSLFSAALAMEPVRLTNAVPPSTVTPLILVSAGSAVFVAPPESQSAGGVIRSCTSPFIRSPGPRSGT